MSKQRETVTSHHLSSSHSKMSSNSKLTTFVSKLVMIAILLFAVFSPLLASEIEDPLEPLNRATFKANDMLDRIVLKPMALTYQRLIPRFAKSMVSNFFQNLAEVPTIINDVLQLKIGRTSADLGRLAVNSTLGVGGLFEVADPLFGLERSQQDFGKTLAQWGVMPGPYIVLPLLGPSSLRDSLDVVVNSVIHPLSSVNHGATQNALLTSRAVDVRTDLLVWDNLIIGDSYLYVREAYSQHRDYIINGDTMLLSFEEP